MTHRTKSAHTLTMRLIRCVALKLVVIVGLTAPALATELRVIGDNWCPYNCAPEAPQRGYMVDMLSRIFGTEPTFSYTLEPWPRAIKMVTQGERDLLLATTPTPNTERGLLLSNPIGVDRPCFFVRRDSPWRYSTIDDLRTQSLGVVQDYQYDGGGPIDTLISDYRKSKNPLLELSYGVDAPLSSFRKLAVGRTDVVIENENVGRHLLTQLDMHKQIEQVGCASHFVGTLHIGVSRHLKDGDKLVTRINKGITQMRNSGELGAVLKSYSVADWQPLLKDAGR
jgi:polar amino acid transport system substrate-binding protein